jgi:hypothetical protein
VLAQEIVEDLDTFLEFLSADASLCSDCPDFSFFAQRLSASVFGF